MSRRAVTAAGGPPPGARPARRVRRALRWLGLAVVVLVGGLIALGWQAFGHRAQGERRERIIRSAQWQDGHFENPQPMTNSLWGVLKGMFQMSPHTSPTGPVPVAPLDAASLQTPPATGLRATWLGHSTTLVEIDGQRVLTDPVWSERASPFTWVGPRRWFTPPIAVRDLPRLDAVVISHDHFDHLDQPTIAALLAAPAGAGAAFVVPLGVGAHLAYWGVPEARIVELDWWEKTRVGALEITCVPARHASGRAVLDSGAKLWGGFALVGAAHRVYYSGDTGLFPAMREIGTRLGPFDLTLIEVGQYHSAWPDWHLGPEQAVRAHGLVRGKVLLPVHWGTFALAYHGWTEPIERALAAGAAAGATLLTPMPGQSVEPATPPPRQRWWPPLPWTKGDADPIVSSLMN